MALSLKTERFKVDVPSHEIKRLKEKVRNTRLPSNPIVPEAGEDYGPPIEWFQRLHQTWTVDFDWESVQQHLNRHEHFLGNIKDEEHNLKLHFVHVRSSRPNAIPLLLVHGWPGSFYEFDRVIDLLSEPKDANVQAFHVVVPSLPGFCWSSAPPRRGWTLKDNARVFNNLMLGLGYLSYGVQAGDWGSFVARELGAQYPACKAVHLNFCPVPLHTPDNELSPREKLVKKRYDDWLDDHLGYAVCMRTRPHTIGVALIDNPVGIMSWVGEKYYEAAAPQKATDPEWDQAILIQSSLYYFTDCIMTSMLPYYENVKHAEFGSYFTRPENRIDVPFAYSSFLYDTRPGTERTVKETGNMVQYRGT
ncbi:epoxide hydrolase [Aaosphaeria arxii CBS 175.79]|uniref:Epoxide hydrolase n=1 Tax=Aaosphaeria arxii CBS 175.79 TaxID=1450172 RepID=A0A6A5Y6K8_9PLEO|nr:epoxide hydrolase [Aaosphaeria arxii CBS 175.79]KAF2021192.1 epoxide hydrolase [Aaosphaeria arxii CBS 175.79]